MGDIIDWLTTTIVNHQESFCRRTVVKLDYEILDENHARQATALVPGSLALNKPRVDGRAECVTDSSSIEPK